MKSIRRHLTVSLLSGMTILVAASGTGCYLLVEETLTSRFDRSLSEKAAALGALVEREVFGVEFAFSEKTMPEYARKDRPEYFQLWLDDGTVAARSPSLGTGSLPRAAGAPGEPVVTPFTLPDGRRGRAAGVRVPIADADFKVVPGDEEKLAEARRLMGVKESTHVTVVCARDTGDLSEALDAILVGLAAAGGALALGVLLLVRHVVAAGCRPLAEMAGRIDGIVPEQASGAELDIECPFELAPFKTSFRRFTDRITEALAREKRVTSNIAHELRTPVSELMTVTEIARLWKEDAELRSKTIDEAHAIAVQMDRVLHTCLRMARLESGASAPATSTVDVSRLLANLCHRAGSVATDHGLRFDQDVPPGLTVRSDPELLELILGNLLDNAVHHAPAGGFVEVTAARNNGSVEVDLANPAGDLEAGDLPRLAEPFWQKDESRSDPRHLGLGLTMVSSAARVVGAALRLDVRNGRFEARLTLPADRDAG